MLIRIDGRELPGLVRTRSDYPDGHPNIMSPCNGGTSRASLGLVRGMPTRRMGARVHGDEHASGVDLKGPSCRAVPARFVYLSWGWSTTRGVHMFRRAKLMLDGVPSDVLRSRRSGAWSAVSA